MPNSTTMPMMVSDGDNTEDIAYSTIAGKKNVDKRT
jgi:hypothetical protein